MRSLALSALALAALPLLSGCSEEAPAAPAPVRPVLSLVVKEGAMRADGFAGSIEPRFTTDLAFRVLGRLQSRDVNVGDVVAKGDRIATIDASTQDLAVRAARSDLLKAEAQLENAASNETRKAELLARNVGARSDVEAAEQTREAAAAAVVQARSTLAKAREQLAYTQIVADLDGVVIAVSAEVGQQVPSGQTVATIANVEIREAVVDMPEAEARKIREGSPFIVALQVDPSTTIRGAVREVAPEADASTGTRRIKITLSGNPTQFRVGTTITATPVHEGEGELRVPDTAILTKDGKSFVWVVMGQGKDAATPPDGAQSGSAGADAEASVALHAVEITDEDGTSTTIVSGIAPGTTIVRAGVNSLSDGQRVKLNEGLTL
ncbi:efflux RND transporter periplasmic adaptor subunit [Mangrovicella endophytica]|uniref:efflux RND transporter periplasmic adaptor subunit n=1 Tax=Mangrovicella endophytica TaxID=2066697 RepID=UPI000C9EC1F5|nr:efflux RND transporter periplasmic adaptor subunit [Mangrovicella endophytica]